MNGILTKRTIRDFNQGDEKAFNQVFDHYYPGLVYFIEKLTGSREEAEDIVLRAFLELFNRCKLFEEEINIKAFLYIASRNSALNFIKANQNRKAQLQQLSEYFSADGNPAFEFELKDNVIIAVRKAINELPEECRRIFKMLYYEELTPAEIAQALNISTSTVYNQKSRALTALRLKFSENSMIVLWILTVLSLI